MQRLLSTRSVTRRFGRVPVLHGIDFELHAGEIHGLVGSNGAGKSTLCKIISGLLPASSGKIELRGSNYAPRSKQEAERRGVDIIQQELNLVPTLSVAENLMLTHLPASYGLIQRRELDKRARKILDDFGLHDVHTRISVGQLGIGHQQMIEIASALAKHCRLLILDEPTAALSPSESKRLFVWLDKLRQQGVGIIYVSHRLEEVAKLTDRISILRDGKLVSTRSTAETTTEDMVEKMSGVNSVEKTGRFKTHSTNELAMVVRGISRGPVKDASFKLFRGERLGIAGLVGAGRTELLRAIFGADVATAGDVQLANNKPVRFLSPAESVRAGIAMVTEDRKDNGLLVSKSIQTNTSLACLKERFSSFGVVHRRSERVATADHCAALDTRYQGVEQIAGTLSGGNQQKVVIAKWLARDADVFLFDEPTRGIDVSARARIHELFASLAAKGKGLVIVSSDLEELFLTCDRIAVMSAGRIVDTFQRGAWTEEKIMQAMFSQES